MNSKQEDHTVFQIKDSPKLGIDEDVYNLVDQYVSWSPPKKMRIVEHVNTSNSRMILVTCLSSTMRSWKLQQGIQVQIDSVLTMMFCISLVHLQLDLKLFEEAPRAMWSHAYFSCSFSVSHPLLQQLWQYSCCMNFCSFARISSSWQVMSMQEDLDRNAQIAS